MELELRHAFYIVVIPIAILLLLGSYEVIDWLFLDDYVKVSEPLVPFKMEITVEGAQIDTIYTYKLP